MSDTKQDVRQAQLDSQADDTYEDDGWGDDLAVFVWSL